MFDLRAPSRVIQLGQLGPFILTKQPSTVALQLAKNWWMPGSLSASDSTCRFPKELGLKTLNLKVIEAIDYIEEYNQRVNIVNICRSWAKQHDSPSHEPSTTNTVTIYSTSSSKVDDTHNQLTSRVVIIL
jgi:hypothetical protein